jgi:hypothetical protein
MLDMYHYMYLKVFQGQQHSKASRNVMHPQKSNKNDTKRCDVKKFIYFRGNVEEIIL